MELQGATAAFNDEVSLSGYHVLRDWLARDAPSLARDAPPAAFFTRWLRTGGHAASLRALRAGRAECAAIDVLVWMRARASQPELCDGLHVLDDVVLATSASQPFVAGMHVPAATRRRLSDALCSLHAGTQSAAAPVALSHVRRFARITDRDYDSTRSLLQRASAVEVSVRAMDDWAADGADADGAGGSADGGADDGSSSGQRQPQRFC